MRILIIPSADLSYNSGSVIYAKKLFVYLTKRGHDVYMLGNCMPSDIPNDISTNIIIKNNLLFHPVIDDRYVSNEMYFYMFRDILDTVSYINSKIGKLDIIHAHYASINSYAALVIYDLLNIPFIVSSFGRDVSIGYDCDNRIRNFIIKSYSSAKRIVVPDEGIKHLVKEKIDMDIEEKIIEVPMPLDDGIFEYSIENVKSLKKKGEIIISSINSCFTKEKGIEIILKALKLILKEHDVFLYIAGGDDDDDDEKINFRRLKSLVDELEISKYVVFLGYLDRAAIGALLAATDIFVDARTKGHFSSVLLEAQFFDVVTLASDNESSQKIISGGNGMFFEQGNPEDLCSKINLIIENSDLLSEIRRNRIKWLHDYGEKFVEKSCFGEMETIYSECLND